MDKADVATYRVCQCSYRGRQAGNVVSNSLVIEVPSPLSVRRSLDGMQVIRHAKP